MSEVIIVFDMDGVLADVVDSYLAAIAETFRHFTGQSLEREIIDQYKLAGGWNNDWALAHELIRKVGNVEAEYDDVVAVFQQSFRGRDFDGLILREKWIPRKGMLERMAESYRLAIFSGRPRAEIDFTLRRFAPSVPWSCIVADEDVMKPKPAPDGLKLVADRTGSARLTYVGDSIDDARSARAFQVPFIGVVANAADSLARLFQAEEARAIVESVNELEGVLHEVCKG